MRVSSIRPRQLNFSTDMRHTTLKLTIRRDGRSTQVEGRVVVSSRRTSVRVMLARGSDVIHLIGGVPVTILLPYTPPLILAIVKGSNGGFRVKGFRFR